MFYFCRFFIVIAAFYNCGLAVDENSSSYTQKSAGISRYSFPENVMLGVGTSAYQIEGAWNESGKGESMWDTYLHKHPDFVGDHTNADVTTDFYHKYKEDIQLIKNLGVKYFRMSISWTRLLPKGTKDFINKDGVTFYSNVFNELLKLNITPVVTLYHWDLPTKFMDIGGWTNPKMIDLFEDYARVVFSLFGDKVKIWSTINEPRQQCANGYGGTTYVPALNDSGVSDYLCNHYMLLAHARTYRLYDREFRRFQNGTIGIALDSIWVEPKDSNKQKDVDAAERYTQVHLGLHAHPIFSREGNYPDVLRKRIDYLSHIQGYQKSRLPYFTPEEIDLLKGSADFLGLNHYSTYLASEGKEGQKWRIPSADHDMNVWIDSNPDWPVLGVPWLSVYPPGIRRHINWISKNYGNHFPIIITENGMADFGALHDYDRVEYFNEYINQILLAIYEDKCNVQGYFAWSLMDDFEWNDGYKYKYGLYSVDFSSPERTRRPKLSAVNFKEILRTRRVNFDFINRSTN